MNFAPSRTGRPEIPRVRRGAGRRGGAEDILPADGFLETERIDCPEEIETRRRPGGRQTAHQPMKGRAFHVSSFVPARAE